MICLLRCTENAIEYEINKTAIFRKLIQNTTDLIIFSRLWPIKCNGILIQIFFERLLEEREYCIL